MVHRSSDAKLAVIGIPFKKGDPDNFVSTVNTGDFCCSYLCL